MLVPAHRSVERHAGAFPCLYSIQNRPYMNLPLLPERPPQTLAIRVGCALDYHVDEPAPMLLMVQPRLAAGQTAVAQHFHIDTGVTVEHLLDSHGNQVLRMMLLPGVNRLRHDAVLFVRSDAADPPADVAPGLLITASMPMDVLRYTLPSRFCESDKLGARASELFGHQVPGLATAQAICDWTHRHLEYRYGSGDPSLSACEAMARGYGVCRDFAHVMVALCRALDIPARYVAGYMPLFEAGDTDIGLDFHAYVEAWIDGGWRVFDPRHNRPHVGRVKIAHGMDAVDCAFATIYGQARTAYFHVWSYPVDHQRVRIGDPVQMPVYASGGV
jgi:transglutaminase-like putative cysteine protease